MTRLLAALSVLPLLLSACTVKLTTSESAEVVQNQCTSDSDCKGGGVCWTSVCVAHEGTLSTLLLELTPPVTAPATGIGGLRYLRMETGLSRSNEQHDLDLQGASTIRGFFKSDCRYDVTLTPQEQSFGLQAVSYIGHTAAAARNGPCAKTLPSGAVQEFVIDVPSGIMGVPALYDVYLRPAADSSGGSAADACPDPPQLLRGGVKAEPGVACNRLDLGMPQSLEVDISWPAGFSPRDGWKADVLDPLSGQVLSQGPVPLTPSTTEQNVYTASLKYSQAMGGESAKSFQELLRLTPRLKEDGPVLLFSLQAATASSSSTSPGMQKAVLPPIGIIPPKVQVDGWVWEVGGMTPVPSTVTLTATRLEGLSSGIFASYSVSVPVGEDGRLLAALFPGDYRVRTIPDRDDDQGQRLASGETTLSVPVTDAPTIAGKTIFVAKAASLHGRAISALRTGIDRAAVELQPATIGVRDCDNPDAGVCDTETLDVLAQSLAQDAFVPRTEAAVTSGDGSFVLDDVDCGECSPRSSALFDLSVQPPAETRIPWIVHPHLSVSTSQSVDVGPLYASFPIIQRGTVQFPSPNKNQEPTPVSLTRIRAFVVRDATGAPVSNPIGLPSCSSGTYSGTVSPTRCIRSVLQVAAASAGPDGKYELVLPSSIELLAP